MSCLDGGWIEKFFCSLGQISVWIEAVLAARDVSWPSAEVRLTVLLLVPVAAGAAIHAISLIALFSFPSFLIYVNLCKRIFSAFLSPDSINPDFKVN